MSSVHQQACFKGKKTSLLHNRIKRQHLWASQGHFRHERSPVQSWIVEVIMQKKEEL